MMRWYTNNTKTVRVAKRGTGTADVGNIQYGKIEGRSRKTDGFMALVAAMTIEDVIGVGVGALEELPVLAF